MCVCVYMWVCHYEHLTAIAGETLLSARTLPWANDHHYIEAFCYSSLAGLYIVSFTNPLASGSGLVERTPKKVII